MRHLSFAAMLCALICQPLPVASQGPDPAGEPIEFSPNDWPWWRGPQRNGVASADQKPPLTWTETKNVIWKAAIPGRGHGSVTVVGTRVFLATADEKAGVQSVLCFDRKTGKRLWKADVHRGGLTKKGNKKSSQASGTVACDGKRVFVSFLNRSAIYTSALSLDGRMLWRAKVCDYTVHQGYGSSPAVFGPLVIVSADNKGGGAIVALDRKTGKAVWRRRRPATPNYASPVILRVDGKDQLLFIGCKLVTSLNPMTGKILWEVAGATTECVTSTVTDGKVIISSGGYPKNHVAAVKGDGSGKVVWGTQDAGLCSVAFDPRRLPVCRHRCRRGDVLEMRHRQTHVAKSTRRQIHRVTRPRR